MNSHDPAVHVLRKRTGANFSRLFKKVTFDNGSEFEKQHEALEDVVDVYFSHPYTSWERGTSSSFPFQRQAND